MDNMPNFCGGMANIVDPDLPLKAVWYGCEQFTQECLSKYLRANMVIKSGLKQIMSSNKGLVKEVLLMSTCNIFFWEEKW